MTRVDVGGQWSSEKTYTVAPVASEMNTLAMRYINLAA